MNNIYNFHHTIYSETGFLNQVSSLSSFITVAFRRKIGIDDYQSKYQYIYFLNNDLIPIPSNMWFLSHIFRKRIKVADIQLLFCASNYDERIDNILNLFPKSNDVNLNNLNTEIIYSDDGMSFTHKGLIPIYIEFAKWYYLEIIQYYLDRMTNIDNRKNEYIESKIHKKCFNISQILIGSILNTFEVNADKMVPFLDNLEMSNESYINNSLYLLFSDEVLYTLYYKIYGGYVDDPYSNESSIIECDTYDECMDKLADALNYGLYNDNVYAGYGI